MLFLRRKKIGTRTCVTLSTYLIIAFIALVIEIINPKLDFSWTATSISMLIIYVMVQSNIIADNRLRAEIYNDLSTKDVLTGLKNRRGYEKMLIKVSDNKVGVVFCDINSLKVVNDTLGHESGDKLIQNFANICINSFPNDFIYRISGDEFVILSINPDPDLFKGKITNFEKELFENDRIASFGYAMGDGNLVLDLVKEAEKKMYEDKNRYYIETGKDRRV